MRHWIVRLTFLLLVVDAGLAIAWCVTQCGALEPYITAIALVATITGLFIDRWLAALERRSELLYLLVHEVWANRLVYREGGYNPEPVPNFTKHYIRLVTTATEAAISSGAFNGGEDVELFTLLHLYREPCVRLNGNFDWIERVLIQMLSTRGQETAHYEAIQRAVVGSPEMTALVTNTDAMMAHLLRCYSQESGIAAGDVLFAPRDHPRSPTRRRVHPVRAWARRRLGEARPGWADLKAEAGRRWARYVAWLERQGRTE